MNINESKNYCILSNSINLPTTAWPPTFRDKISNN